MKHPLLSVRDVMEPQPVTVASDRQLGEVVELMNARRIGSVIVVDGAGQLQGIFTERDLLRHIVQAPPDWQRRPVAEWMTPRPHTIGPQVDWEEAIQRMEKLRVRHLPVVENGMVVGIISTRLLMSRRADYLNRQVEARTQALRQLNDELLARDAELRQNLKAAARFQARLLLPAGPPRCPDISWSIHFAPLDHLGGDFYDIAQPDSDHLGFIIADASGHSIAAMMVAVITRIAFSEIAPTTSSPGQVLTALNERLQGLADDRFVTAFYCVLDRPSGELRYANAGHPPPLYYSARDRVVQPLRAFGFMLGIMPGENYRERHIALQPGDKIVFYTDGLVDARNEIGEAFGMDRLQDCIHQYGDGNTDDLCRAILERQRAFSGRQPVSDDITLVVVGYRGRAGVESPDGSG